MWLLESEPTVSPAVNRFAHALGEHQNLGTRLAISRDGRRIAYTANGQIYVRVLDDLVARPVPGTAVGAAPLSPFFSPDGESIAFFAQGRLMKVPVAGGIPVPLGNASVIRRRELERRRHDCLCPVRIDLANLGGRWSA